MIFSVVEMGWVDSVDGVYEFDKFVFFIGDDVFLKVFGMMKKEKTFEFEFEFEFEFVVNEIGGLKKDKKKKKKGGK